MVYSKTSYDHLTIKIMIRGLYYKAYNGSNLRISVISKSVYPWQAFAGKAGAYLSEAPFRCSTLG